MHSLTYKHGNDTKLRSLRTGREITPLRATDPETKTCNNNVV